MTGVGWWCLVSMVRNFLFGESSKTQDKTKRNEVLSPTREYSKWNTSSTKSKDTSNVNNVVPISSGSSSNNATNSGHAPLRRSYTSIVTTLIEQHRKLDRSVSEPTSRYKTELCRPFEESGACKYGDKCQFAHGYTELRNLARHPKYKTELCRTFHSIGFCPYGPRCHFIHNFEEARIHNQKVSDEIGLPQPNIMGLNPFLAAAAAAAAAAANNVGTTTTSNTNNINNNNNNAAAVAVAVAGAAATNSSNNNNNNNNNPVNSANLNVGLLKQIAVASSSQEAAVAAVAAAANSSQNLIRTNSLSSAFTDSGSPPSSLSQSPTNSMASFFGDEQGNLTTNNLSTTAFSFGHNFGLIEPRQTPSPHTNLCSSLSSDDIVPRTPSPLSPNAESRLPVFNRISSTLADFENLKI
ncbi:hypothetical protein M0804_010511 [Polistes exclamans]|nr:hypothetical protein M0804_010511 [Polistes exclamans]